MDKTLNYYNDNAETFAENTRDIEFSEIQDMFLDLIPPGGHILDLGCGSGRDTKCFLSKGYLVDAVDGSEELVKLASEYTGINVRQMLFKDLDVYERYDGVWACASILHLDHAQLIEVLKKIHRALMPNGVLYTSFKYGSYSGERNGRFFSDMTEESWKEMMDSVGGFKLIKQWITSDARPGREDEKWLNLLIRKTE